MTFSKCTDCKHAGDVHEICPRYLIGRAEDGSPIRRDYEYPSLCRDCPDRDSDFCMKFKDLICYNEQDPFDCKTDLEKDDLYGNELLRKHMEATEKALLKRGLTPRILLSNIMVFLTFL